MKIKLKKKKKIETAPYPLVKGDRLTEICTNLNSPNGLYNAFSDRCRQIERDSKAPTKILKYIQYIYNLLFEKPIPSDATYVMAKIRIAYYLTWLGHHRCGLTLDPKVQANMDAAWNYDKPKLSNTLSTLVNVLENQELKGGNEGIKQRHITEKEKLNFKFKGEKTMAKLKLKKKASTPEVLTTPAEPVKKVKKVKKVKEVKKSKPKKGGPSVAEYYITLFKKNYKAKLTDDKLAEEMRKQFPENKKYTAKDMKSVRSMFNKGKIAGQEEAPKSQLKQF